jgi:hypothetical protein
MRSITCLALLVAALPLLAQDPSLIATQAAMQANQQAMQANQNASQAAQQVSASEGFGPALVSRPKFSIKTGTYNSPQTVSLKDSARGAVIFYTTDGWTPTPLSPQYDGPIVIASTTHLQAIAVVPYQGRSRVADAVFTLPGTSVLVPNNVLVGEDGILHKGTNIPLAVGSDIESKTAQVGDKIPLLLMSSIQIGSQIIDPAKSAAQATVIHVDRNGVAGAPGVLTIRVDSLTVNGALIPLSAIETREGKDHIGRVFSTAWIPVVGVASLAHHGENADIDRGTPIMARVAADTLITRKSATIAFGRPSD